MQKPKILVARITRNLFVYISSLTRQLRQKINVYKCVSYDPYFAFSAGPGDQCRDAYLEDCDPETWDEVIKKSSDFTETENK